MSKLVKMKSFITSLFGIKEYRLNEENHLDVSAEDYAKLTENYGADFVVKFEKLLKEEASSSLTEQKNDTNQTKTDMNLTLLCALLAVNAISVVDGKATLSEEQLGKIEAGLKKLEDEKTAAESSLATAKTEKVNAETSLSGAVKALDELGSTVAEAKTPTEKVAAVRTILAGKAGADPSLTLGKDGKESSKGSDEINAYVQKYLS